MLVHLYIYIYSQCDEGFKLGGACMGFPRTAAVTASPQQNNNIFFVCLREGYCTNIGQTFLIFRSHISIRNGFSTKHVTLYSYMWLYMLAFVLVRCILAVRNWVLNVHRVKRISLCLFNGNYRFFVDFKLLSLPSEFNV